MAKRRKIQDNDWRYDILQSIVSFTLKASYRTITYTGMERIPQDGAVIFAPNHSGALMDALVVVAMDNKPKVFLARADIFKARCAIELTSTGYSSTIDRRGTPVSIN